MTSCMNVNTKLCVMCLGGNKKSPIDKELLFRLSDCCPPNTVDDQVSPPCPDGPYTKEHHS